MTGRFRNKWVDKVEDLERENAELRAQLEYTQMINKKQRVLIGRILRANNERVLVH